MPTPLILAGRWLACTPRPNFRGLRLVWAVGEVASGCDRRSHGCAAANMARHSTSCSASDKWSDSGKPELPRQYRLRGMASGVGVSELGFIPRRPTDDVTCVGNAARWSC